MGFTHLQTTKLNSITKSHFTGLAPQRQVTAIQKWILHNRKHHGLEVFPINSDKELRQQVSNIAQWMGCYTANPTFQSALLQITVRSGNQYRELIGTHGRVPAEVVEQICVQYNIQPAVVLDACSRYTAPKGGNGIKTLTHRTYQAELKLMPMGKERIFATTQSGNKYVFNLVAKKL